MRDKPRDPEADWDFSSDDRFTDYYAEQSRTPDAYARNRGLRDAILRLHARNGGADGPLDVLDVGCNAGAMCMTWAELGHRVAGLDVNGPLLELARKRSTEAGFDIDFRLGTATDLPWPDGSLDVCIAIELLEHVEDWQSCLWEFVRVLKPGGVLCVTTTNVLCPKQNEFKLPLYSWYPAPLQRYFVKLAMSTRPELANYAKYPAFHWFSFYSLRAFLWRQGLQCIDQFELTEEQDKGPLGRIVLDGIRKIPLFKMLAFATLPGTIIFGAKDTY